MGLVQNIMFNQLGVFSVFLHPGLLVFQFRPAHSAGRLCGVSDAFSAYRERGKSSAAVRKRAQAAGEPDGRRPLHDAVQ